MNTNNTTMTAQSAKTIIQSRKKIEKIGKIPLKVTNVTPYMRLDETTGEMIETKILNFNAMTSYQLKEAIELFKKGDFQGATNKGVSASVRVGKDYVPVKGEIVNVMFDEITTKNGVSGLFPTNVTEIAATAASNVVFNFEFDDALIETKEEAVKEETY